MAQNTEKSSSAESTEALQVNSTLLGTSYAQVASMHVTDTDVTFEFIYIYPSIKQGQVVSRVTMPKLQVKSFIETLQDVIKQHDNTTKNK